MCKGMCKRCIKFNTENNSYLYFPDSKTVFSNNIDEERKQFFEKYSLIKDEKFFESIVVTEEDIKEQIYSVGLTELILDVTTQCNLRCRYCIFGGNYNYSRAHSDNYMSIETAKKAIDMYYGYFKDAAGYNPYRIPVIAFYGGEPLLNFELVKFCVNYISDRYKEYDTYFTITTNGTLLTEDKIRFLVENNIHPIISLDGPKEEHDRNRIFPNGKGTFDIVYRNITKYYELRKEPAICISVFDLKTDLMNLANFFDNEDKLICINSVPVKSANTDYYSQFTKEDGERFLESEQKLENYFFSEVIGNREKMFSFANRYFIDRCLPFINNRVDVNPENLRLIKMTGACIPGNKISVSVDGSLHMCEKISRQFPIGNVTEGLNFAKICDMVNDYNAATKSCKSCSFRNSCSNCEVILENEECFKVNPKFCEKYKISFVKDLEFAYKILEKDPLWSHESVSQYYKELQEMVVRFQ